MVGKYQLVVWHYILQHRLYASSRPFTFALTAFFLMLLTKTCFKECREHMQREYCHDALISFKGIIEHARKHDIRGKYTEQRGGREIEGEREREKERAHRVRLREREPY